MRIDPVIHKIINQELKQIESEYGVVVQLALESGSRGWGFPSRDSDYDVRFIYSWPLESYLAITPPRETLNFAVKNELDISGWDLRKVLRHIRKSNAVMFEWFQSPVVYSQREDFRVRVLKLAQTFFSPQAALNHYLGLLQKFYPVLDDGAEIRCKKLFYILRPLLAASWIVRHGNIPPMEFMELMDASDKEAAVFPFIRELLAEKERGNEKTLVLLPAGVREFIDRRKGECEKARAHFHAVRHPEQPLNDFFLDILERSRGEFDGE